MKRNNSLLITVSMVIMALFAGSAVARIQKDARECVKPRFSKFTPPHLSEVLPGSKVSFVTNHTTGKATITVTAKGIAVQPLKITDKKSFYLVEFDLPEELTNTYARLHIKANAKIGPSTCKHKDGWLLKIGGDTEPEQKAVETTESSVTDVKATATEEQPASPVVELVSEVEPAVALEEAAPAAAEGAAEPVEAAKE